MPIVNTIFDGEDNVNPDGSRTITVRNFDQDGKEYKYSQHAAAGFDYHADNLIKIAMLNEQLASQEFEALIGQG